MARGTVKWFKPEKGYGFIQPTGGGNVFVHISAVRARAEWALPSMKVSQTRASRSRRTHGDLRGEPQGEPLSPACHEGMCAPNVDGRGWEPRLGSARGIQNGLTALKFRLRRSEANIL